MPVVAELAAEYTAAKEQIATKDLAANKMRDRLTALTESKDSITEQLQTYQRDLDQQRSLGAELQAEVAAAGTREQVLQQTIAEQQLSMQTAKEELQGTVCISFMLSKLTSQGYVKRLT